MTGPVTERPSPPAWEEHPPAHWASRLEEVYGRIEIDTSGDMSICGSILCADLWRLRLWRIELTRHGMMLPPSLARPGTHSLNIVRFQTKGETVFEQDGRALSLEPGDCLAYNASRAHQFLSEAGTAYDTVVMPHALIRQQTVPVELLWARKLPANEMNDMISLAHETIGTILRTRPSLPPAPASSMAYALMNLLSMGFARREIGAAGFTRGSIMRSRAKIYIADHLRDTDLNPAQIAAALRCSKRYLYTIFEEEGIGVQAYIWRTRIEQARAELESPSGAMKSITDVAFSWGFSSVSHFSRLFRRHFKVTPSLIRAMDHGPTPATPRSPLTGT